MEAQKHAPDVYEQADRLTKLSEQLRDVRNYTEANRINEEILRVQRQIVRVQKQIAQAMKAQEDYEKARRKVGRAG